ncbi:pilus assembly protein PilM [Herbivorax sp. ANBcel31]|uniref:pilus assembly protein PilM n=1 Tax=Herbivorax sp. ANBcel31 TaxID=3069754 RepID=UPI0027B161AD|nr:pilus assembly protein PilM [Herbivorax sp. ANBcel31]MDQ2086174.1 pilus assembly protein PilM [Herbivorax sp. ANBcel31]
MFLDLLFRKTSMVCIDVGYRNIKVVEVSVRKNNNIFIENYGIVSTPPDCIKNGAIYDVERVLRVIKAVIKEEGMKAKNAKIIMSGTNIITRIYMIDKAEGESEDFTIKNSMPNFLPVDIDNYRVDYKLLQTVTDKNREIYKVFVTAVPRKILESYIDVLQGLDLKPLAVDIPANSTAKFFNRDIYTKDMDEYYSKRKHKNVQSDTYAVLDFGSETTIVNFLKDRVLEFNKVILSGSSNIDNHISNEMNISLQEAERLKKTYGMTQPNSLSKRDHVVAYGKVSSFIERLVMQIVKCFEFYIERCYGSQISKIFIIGGGSQLNGLDQYLFSIFKVPVYPVGLLSLKGVELRKNLDREKLNYLINSVGISL